MYKVETSFSGRREYYFATIKLLPQCFLYTSCIFIDHVIHYSKHGIFEEGIGFEQKINPEFPWTIRSAPFDVFEILESFLITLIYLNTKINLYLIIKEEAFPWFGPLVSSVRARVFFVRHLPMSVQSTARTHVTQEESDPNYRTYIRPLKQEFDPNFNTVAALPVTLHHVSIYWIGRPLRALQIGSPERID
jgi:hypothetical protein